MLINDSPMLQIDNVSFWYNSADPPIVYNCCLTVNAHEFVAVVGESGGGKTTILRLACGLLQRSLNNGELPGSAYTGTVTFKRHLIVGPDRHFGYVPQNFSAGLYPKQTALGNVLLGVSESGVSDEEKVLAHKLLLLARLNDVAEVNVKRLSGGQQQRVAICRALVKEPELLFMDEPFANIDATRRKGMVDLMHDLRRERDNNPLAALVVTHDIEGAVNFADKIFCVRTHYHGPEYCTINLNAFSDKRLARAKVEDWLTQQN